MKQLQAEPWFLESHETNLVAPRLSTFELVIMIQREDNSSF